MTRSVVPPAAPGSARSHRSRAALTVAATVALAGALLTAPAGEAVAETTISETSTEQLVLNPGSPESSSVEVSGASGTVRSVEVHIASLTHLDPSALEISLTSPDGTEVGLLGSCSGSSGVDDLDLHFASGGTPIYEFTSLAVAAQPIKPTVCTGTLPTEFAEFVDEDPNGTWTLTVQSAATGSLESWTLDLVIGEAPQIAYTTGLDNPLVVDASASLLYHRPTLTAPFTVTTPPSHGSLSLDVSAGGFTYAPDAGYSGPDVFSGTDSDGTPFTVDLTVAPSGVEGGTTRIAASTTPFALGAGGSIGSSPTSTAIDVDGGAQVVAEAEITLVGFEHELLRHVMAAVETPDGTASTLTDNCGDDYWISGDITFADGGVPLPDDLTGTPGELTSGTYAPQRCIFPTSAQPGIGEVTAVGFGPLTDEPADGDWELYLYDDGPGGEGTVAGWLLRMVTVDEVAVPPSAEPAPHVFRTTPQTPLHVDGSATAVAIDAPVAEITDIDDSATTGAVTFDAGSGSFAYRPADGFTGLDTFEIHTASTQTTVVVVVDGVPGPNRVTYVADDGRGMSIPYSGIVEQSLTMTDPGNSLAPDIAPSSIVDASATLFGLQHTYPADLVISLASGGRSLDLLNRCGSGNDIEGLTLEFTDAAAGLAGPTISSGRYAPTTCAGGSAGTFTEEFVGNGLPADGPWTLTIDDTYDGDGGALTSWRVSVTTAVDLMLVDASFTVAEDGTLVRDQASGLATAASGAAAAEASYAVVSEPEHGSLELDPSGAFTYVPDPDFFGTDTFTATATAGGFTTEPATISIEVTGVNDPPIANDASFSVISGERLSGDLTGSATDADDDPVTFSVVAPPEHGTLDLAPDGTFTYISDLGFAGDDEFTFGVSDLRAPPSPLPDEGPSEAQVRIEVLPAQTPSPTEDPSIDPTATDDPSPTGADPGDEHPSSGPATETTETPAGTDDGLPSTGVSSLGVIAVPMLLLTGGLALALRRHRFHPERMGH
ncbi:Ig-like domain-containing protein [Ruania rhizosphaerae]|uniref:Ig-like domain-containing protein n=1 Tax=Ruania rhizosphaerae TaxID=1840413 RepID=UPI0013570869|nr:Ig-like domain-containing protein [Ruania rhizosphaerae]